jgi:hypothetical protein
MRNANHRVVVGLVVKLMVGLRAIGDYRRYQRTVWSLHEPKHEGELHAALAGAGCAGLEKLQLLPPTQ